MERRPCPVQASPMSSDKTLDVIVIPSFFCQLVYSFIHLLSCVFVCLFRYHPPDGSFPGQEIFKLVGELETALYKAQGVSNM